MTTATATRPRNPTRAPQSPFDRAIERATATGLQVVGVGRFKRTGTRFYLVPSQSRPLGNHVVRLIGHSLVCDCEGAAHGRVCVHRAAVHMYLVVAAERRRARAEVQEQLLRAEAGAEAEEGDEAEAEREDDAVLRRLAAEEPAIADLLTAPSTRHEHGHEREDDAQARREQWLERNMGGACLDIYRGWC